ncbi:SufE family protein [Brachybacterium halotolerans subsp. kimchii]|uniref:SufE family protein n=1 Tax=Brachybacterium halotolerans TaxID=2795215 RepID=UPI001E4CC15E|nr:SufE family protein [Brachybacterium halotolerans]UEJ81711.1 SufE family protein [Brachybacterium halotolerans subsp. kimchii]
MTAPSGDATASDGPADQGTSAPLPEAFAEIVDDFHAVSGNDRVQMLLEFADDLPELPERYRDHPELLEPVPECQSPIFVITEVDGQGEDAPARLFFSAPPEAPTTRGFAGILAAGLEGLTVGQIRAVPADVTENLGLAEVVSPLRLRGMAGMLGRIKRQLGEKAGLQ